jgi:hypothetical protein
MPRPRPIAANDDAKQPEVKDKLKEAFAQASLTVARRRRSAC